MKNSRLLKVLACAEGVEDLTELLESAVTDSVVPGVCRACESTLTDVEPDARNNYCYDCGERAVVSCLVLAGLL